MKGKLVMTVAEMAEHDKWLEARNKGIGGSEAAVIVGMNRWKSPFQLWLEKTGEVEPEDLSNNEFVYWGTVLEQCVADRFAELTGKRVTKRGMLQDEEVPYFFANVDRVVVGENAGLECKTTTYHNADEWTDDKVPMHYEYQCRFYMGVRDLPFWDIACMWGNGEKDFPIRRIYRDFAIEEMIFETIAAFIQSIHNNQPPSMADVAPALAMKSLARIYAAGTLAAPTIEFGRKHERPIRRIAALQQMNRDLDRQIRQNEKEVMALSVQIADTMREHEHGILETPLERFQIDYTASNQRRVNGEKLKKQYPVIYEEVLNPPSQRRIKITAVTK